MNGETPLNNHLHYMNVLVKGVFLKERLLRKYKYPPEQAAGALDIVIKQAELMSKNLEVPFICEVVVFCATTSFT